MVVINALLLQVTAYLVKGFTVAGFWPSVGGAIVISLVTIILNVVVGFERESVDVPPPSSRPPKILNSPHCFATVPPPSLWRMACSMIYH